jgi:type II secretory pathway predicted ATPase ExeA
MFLEYYGLREQPFGVTPDPRFIYFGPAHREALASLLYAIETKRGFSAMVAEPGMGKTSLLFRLLESLRTSARTAFLFQTNGDSKELLRGLLNDLGIKSRGKGVAAMHADLNKTLLEEMQAGRKTVLVIDEAQNLDESALESIRLLSNFETATEKLMHIVLAGQPKLADTLARHDLVQLRQRVATIIQLRPFLPEEVAAYVKHRLHAAGYEGQPIFSGEALQTIARVSGGIPRDINSLCFQALSIGYAVQTKTIGADILREVVVDFEGAPNFEHPAAAPVDSPAAPAAAANNVPSPSARVTDWRPSPPPALENPAPVFWNYDPPVEEPVARRGRKSMMALAGVAMVVASIVIFSDPSLGLTATPPGRISSQIVDAVLSSGDPNSDFLPATPKALEPPAAPAVTTTQDATTTTAAGAGNQQAQNVDDVTAGSGDPRSSASQEQANDLPQTPPRAASETAPKGKERPVANRHADATDSEKGAIEYDGPSAVQVERRENLFEFALETFGRSNWTIVEEICELNPTIRGPYAMLSPGQWVRLPREVPADSPESDMHRFASQQQP